MLKTDDRRCARAMRILIVLGHAAVASWAFHSSRTPSSGRFEDVRRTMVASDGPANALDDPSGRTKERVRLDNLQKITFSPDLLKKPVASKREEMETEPQSVEHEESAESEEKYRLPKLFPTKEEIQQAMKDAIVDATKAGFKFAMETGRQTWSLTADAVQQMQQAMQARADLATSVGKFYSAFNDGNIDAAVAQFAPDCAVEDATYYTTYKGKSDLKRHLLLRFDAYDVPVKYVVDEYTFSRPRDKAGVRYHLEQDGTPLPNSRRCAFFTLEPDTKLIQSCFDVVEPANKVGEINLLVLNLASKVIALSGTIGNGLWDLFAPKFDIPQPLVAVGGVIKRISSETATLMSAGVKQITKVQQDPKSKSVPRSEDKGSGFETNQASELATTRLLGKDRWRQMKIETAPEKYFEAWNARDMSLAANLFTDDCAYEDTVFPKPFRGRAALKKHLLRCSDAFPSTFQFVVDDLADGGDSVAVRWHVEDKGEQLPFTRGCSFYKVDAESGKISEGFDELEPAVLKLGGPKLLFNSLKTKISKEPERLVPLAVWISYMYILFFSNGILPGADALQLEQRTWEEVRDLSLNFFLVSPLLNLPFSPVVHPILEGVFNLLLSWAALFAGFFSDERDDKPNLFPIIPAVFGMQLLTSAFYLPYIASRTTEKVSTEDKIFREDLGKAAQVVESRAIGPFLGVVGTGSILWGILGRQADFGDWGERVASFWDLISIDRVGSSFLVDLAIFALFQGWLVDDDLKRRGVDVESQEISALRNVAKYVPFFGLAAYMALRPKYPSRADGP